MAPPFRIPGGAFLVQFGDFEPGCPHDYRGGFDAARANGSGQTDPGALLRNPYLGWAKCILRIVGSAPMIRGAPVGMIVIATP
jgi:hypothetical protein